MTIWLKFGGRRVILASPIGQTNLICNLFINRFDGQNWKVEHELAGHSDWVRDVAWAPNIGLPQHTIVSCSQDRTALVWKSDDGQTWHKTPLTTEPFPDTLWRVNFSPAGHLLALAGGDNKVSLWRELEDGQWECVSNVDQAALASLNQ